MSQLYLSDEGILRLIQIPKEIVEKKPRVGFTENGEYRSCRLKLYSTDAREDAFEVFTNQHTRFPEGFSIGLRYKTEAKELGTITLVRYNGAHGETSRNPDGHYCTPHIHRITAEEIASGSNHPQEKHREITDRYKTFKDALDIFFKDTGIVNYSEFSFYIRPKQQELV